jgi:hypothetical protein
MSEQWYEVWADESLTTPYILLVLPGEQTAGGVIILDPKEGSKVVYAAPSYDGARDWLLEDEYTRVEGRMSREV